MRRTGLRFVEHGDDGGPTLAAVLAAPGVSEIVELRSRFGLMAIHGGALEAGTEEIATLAAEQAGASLYAVSYPDEVDLHLASTRYDPAESDGLRGFLDHVDVVISIHGYGRDGHWLRLLLGGVNRALAEHVAGALRARLPDYELVTDLDAIPVGLRGMNPANPVNRPAGGGVQLELPPRVRGTSPLSPPPGDDGLSPPTRALIDGLAEAAHTWPS